MRDRIRLLAVPLTAVVIGIPIIGARNVTPRLSSSRADSAVVAGVVNDFHAALTHGDSAKALGLLAADAVILESGYFESRAEYRSHHLPEDIKFAMSVATKREPLQVIVNGVTAWTATTTTSQGQFEGRPVNSAGAESIVLSKQGGRWRIRSIHWSSHKRT